jgi:hypothetical protein
MDHAQRQLVIFLFVEQEGGDLHAVPLAAQRFDNGGQHQPLDVGSRRVVCAQFVAFDGIQRPFQQRTKDGGLHVAPVRFGRFDEQLQLGGVDGQRFGAGKELAVELGDRRAQHHREAALVHGLPEMVDHGHEVLWVWQYVGQQAGEGFVRQQLHVFRKHGEETAHEKAGHFLGGMGVLQ